MALQFKAFEFQLSQAKIAMQQKSGSIQTQKTSKKSKEAHDKEDFSKQGGSRDESVANLIAVDPNLQA